MNCLLDINVIYTLWKNDIYIIRAPMYRAAGGVHGRGACMTGGGVHGRGCVWQGDVCGGGACMAGSAHGRGMRGRGVCVWQGGCLVGGRGHVWQILRDKVN